MNGEYISLGHANMQLEIIRKKLKKLKNSMNRKIVYVAHPIRGDVKANLVDLSRILRIINTNSHPNKMDTSNIGLDCKEEYFDFRDIVPCAPYYADILALDDNNPLERKRGIDNDTELIMTGIFEELWLTGTHISFGMNEEIKLFRSLGKPIIDYTNKI